MLSGMIGPMRRNAPGGHPPSSSPSNSPSLRERIATLRYVPPLIKLIWQTHRGYTVIMIALRLSLAFVPVSTLWVGNSNNRSLLTQRSAVGTKAERLFFGDLPRD
jgi:hypothetical protein